MMQNIPTEAYELGTPIKEYKSRSLNLKGGPIVTLISLAFLLISCQTKGGIVILGMIALIGVPFGIIITMHGFANRNLRVVVFQHGFMYQKGKKIHAIK